MNRKSLAIMATSVVLFTAACGGSKGSQTDAGGNSGGSGNEDGPTFIYIPPNPVGVNEFLKMGEDGTKEAAERLGGTAKTYESTDQSSRRANVEAAIEEEPDVIVLTSTQMIDLGAEYSELNPDQQFILIDVCPDDPAPNMHCALFREYETSYLLGIQAAMLSETGKIGSVVAQDIPFLHRYSDSFDLGANDTDAAVSTTQIFIEGENAYSDPAKAKEQALSLIGRDIDHIFAVGAGSNGGIFEAAEEKGVYTYGVDTNQCDQAPGHVVDNAMKYVDVAVSDLIEQILNDTAEQINSYGLAEAGTGVVALDEDVADTSCVIAEHPEVIDAVRDAAQKIIDGEIVVPDPMEG